MSDFEDALRELGASVPALMFFDLSLRSPELFFIVKLCPDIKQTRYRVKYFKKLNKLCFSLIPL